MGGSVGTDDKEDRLALPSTARGRDSLDRARVRTIYGNGLLIFFLVAFSTLTRASLDPATLVTLIAFELALFGIGPFINLPGTR